MDLDREHLAGRVERECFERAFDTLREQGLDERQAVRRDEVQDGAPDEIALGIPEQAAHRLVHLEHDPVARDEERLGRGVRKPTEALLADAQGPSNG